jgi:hypothetical protein
LLTTDTDPLRVPAAPGLKVTPMAQLAPTLTVVQVLLATVNSLGLLLDTPDTLTAAPPVLEIVTVLDALVVPTSWSAKLNDEGSDKWPGAATALPVPLTPMVSAPPVRLTVMLLLKAPAAVGWKATLKLQLPPAATVTLLHVLADSGKCVASGVLAVTASADAVPTFVIVIVVVALVALTAVDGKLTGAGDACRLGVPPPEGQAEG